jgi:RNA polymerase primary sigma factor
VDDDTSRDELERRIKDGLTVLTSRERQVIEWRFGIVDGRARTLEETGRPLNLTRDQVRRVEAEALKKLRDAAQFRTDGLV